MERERILKPAHAFVVVVVVVAALDTKCGLRVDSFTLPAGKIQAKTIQSISIVHPIVSILLATNPPFCLLPQGRLIP